MTKSINARGLSCPQPVLMTLAEIKAGAAEEITVLLDNEAAKENVSRAASSRGWKVTEITETDGAFCLTIAKG